MAVAALSNEGNIARLIEALGMTATQLCRIGRRRHISISDAKLSHAMSGKKPLDQQTAEQLIELLTDLGQLRKTLLTTSGPVAPQINWDDDAVVADMVLYETVRRLDRELREKGFL